MSDVLVSKLVDMARARKRAERGLASMGAARLAPYEKDDYRRDAVVLNLQHFLEDLFDCCRHVVRARELGVPKDNREVFGMLHDEGLIDADTRDCLQKANGLRNVVVHRYIRTDMEIIRRAVDRDIGRLYEIANQLVCDERKRVADAHAEDSAGLDGGEVPVP